MTGNPEDLHLQDEAIKAKFPDFNRETWLREGDTVKLDNPITLKTATETGTKADVLRITYKEPESISSIKEIQLIKTKVELGMQMPVEVKAIIYKKEKTYAGEEKPKEILELANMRVIAHDGEGKRIEVGAPTFDNVALQEFGGTQATQANFEEIIAAFVNAVRDILATSGNVSSPTKEKWERELNKAGSEFGAKIREAKTKAREEAATSPQQ